MIFLHYILYSPVWFWFAQIFALSFWMIDCFASQSSRVPVLFLNRYDVTYCKNSSFSMEVNSTCWVLHLSVVIPWNCPGLLVCLLAFFLPLFYFLLKLFLLFHTAFPCSAWILKSVQPCLEEPSRNSFMESTPGCRVPSAIQHVSRRLPIGYAKTWGSIPFFEV